VIEDPAVTESGEQPFQFHLSTILIFFNVAVGLVYGNLFPRETLYWETINRDGAAEYTADYHHYNCGLVRYGWPVPIYEYYKSYDGKPHEPYGTATGFHRLNEINGSAIIANVMGGMMSGALALFIANLLAREPTEAKVASQRAQEAGSTISRLKKLNAKEKDTPPTDK